MPALAALIMIWVSCFAPLAADDHKKSGEKKHTSIPISELPELARQKILKLAEGKPITNVVLETEKGIALYEAKFQDKNGVVTEIKVDGAGKLISSHIEKKEKFKGKSKEKKEKDDD